MDSIQLMKAREPLRGVTKFPGVPNIHLINLGSWSWNQRVLLNLGLPEW